MRDRRKRLIFLAVSAAIYTVSLVFRISHSIAMGGSLSDSLAAVGLGVLIVLVITGAVLAISKFTQNASLARLRAEHPGALIVKTLWNNTLANPFLPTGRKQSSARVTGYYVGLVIDDQGIGIARMTRRPAEFGFISWERVRSVQIDQAQVALIGRRTRPTIVIAYEDDPGPFLNRIELLVIGKGARAAAATLPGTILSRRPVDMDIPVPSTWLPPVFPPAPVEPPGHVGP